MAEAPYALLDAMKIHVTDGAAPGYVTDATCGSCHAKIAASYADVAMAQSFYRPAAAKVIEDFANPAYFHAPSGRHYRMELRGDDYWFHRHRQAADGSQLDVFEVKVDWIVGSGNHSRVYLYQVPDGAMFQLPLAWYSQDQKWAMAPGFEFADHKGVMRPVERRCMACHNAYPDVPAGSDRVGMPEHFPTDLPQGIGCQRCHGPGAEHVQLALDAEVSGDVTTIEIRDSIVDPGNLPAERSYDICKSCHLQPTVSIGAQLRFGRGAYAFRPGEVLSAHQSTMDIVDGLRELRERFDINHHPYRMEQSACFIESQGALGCLSCHDPHSKVAPEQRAAHYRQVCLECHQIDDAGLPVMQRAGASHPVLSADPDCTTCHMPARRTQDVIEVTMTDHLIQRTPGAADPVARIAKEQAELREIHLFDSAAELGQDGRKIVNRMAILGYTGGRADYAAEDLHGVLRREPGDDYEPWLKLAESFVALGDLDGATEAVQQVLARDPSNVQGREFAAIVRFRGGDPAGAIADLVAIQAEYPLYARLQFNIAAMQAALGENAAAMTGARSTLEQSPTFWPAWQLIGKLLAAQGDNAGAAEAFYHALAIEPGAPAARAGLVAALDALGRGAEADAYRQP